MADKQSWPPIEWLWKLHRINRAWYSGDPAQLKVTGMFWAGREKIKAHVPVAHELSSMASSMLFAGSPSVTLEEEKANERLQKILDENTFYSLLLQAAESQSAMGGVFLKINWDTALVSRPILTMLPADAGLPRYQNGILVGCTFWSQLRHDETTGAIWRLQEEYTRDGRIFAKLFRGDASNLGTEAGLQSIPEAAGINPESVSGTDMLLATYIPCRLPNRVMESAPYGMSDYCGLYGLFSALDETYSAMLRDVRHGKSRIVVPMEFLRRKGALFDAVDQAGGTDWIFDGNEEVFTALDINPEDSGAGITFVQPSLRADQYQTAINDLMHRIYTMAGYSPQSAGLDIEGRAESGTALNVRERRSMQTIDARRAVWWHAIRDIVHALLAVDKRIFDGPGGDGVTVTFADNSQPDMQTTADTLDKLERAGAVSTETKVRMVNPDWNDERVGAEVQKIREEKGFTGDDPMDAGLGDLEGAASVGGED